MGLSDLFRPRWKHSNQEVRRHAVATISEQAILLEIATSDSDFDVRRVAAARISDQAALAKIATTDRDEDVRSVAAARLSDPKQLTEIARTDKGEKVREAAIEALARLGDPVAAQGLCSVLSDSEQETRTVAAAALARMGEPGISALLEKFAVLKPDGKYTAARLFGELGERRAAKVLCKALASRDPYVVRAAAQALGAIGDPDAVEPLCGLLEERSYESPSEEAAKALGRIRDPRAIPHLIRALTNPRANPERALTALVPESVEPMLSALASAPAGSGIASNLGRVLCEIDVKHLQSEVARACLPSLLLGLPRNPYVVPVLDRIDPNWKVAERALQALQMAVKAADEKTRLEAVKALGSVSDERAVDALVDALQDKSLVTAAAQALRSIGGQRAERALASVAVDVARLEASEASAEVNRYADQFSNLVWAPGYPLNAAAFYRESDVLNAVERLQALNQNGCVEAGKLLERVAQHLEGCLSGPQAIAIRQLHRGESRLSFAQFLLGHMGAAAAKP